MLAILVCVSPRFIRFAFGCEINHGSRLLNEDQSLINMRHDHSKGMEAVAGLKVARADTCCPGKMLNGGDLGYIPVQTFLFNVI